MGRKVTQREIARIAGVSQATVSLVLNDRDFSNVRIPEATRERVRRAIEQTAYVADPAARRLAGLDNKIIGVFTYEPALSHESMDFYGPLLNGLEQGAERLGCDLLFFTSSPVVDGKRRMFDKRTRLRLADGCILLGQEMDGDELRKLVDEGVPFVAVGRRDEPDVPYVGIDYRTLVAELVDSVAELGHRGAAYVHLGRTSPSSVDRLAGIEQARSRSAMPVTLIDVSQQPLPAVAETIAASGLTAVVAQDSFVAEALAHELGERGVSVPREISLAVAGEVEGHAVAGHRLSGCHLPRIEIAGEALAVLQQLIGGAEPPSDVDTRVLLSGSVVPGETLVRPEAVR
ncbi:LacI family DNA-binding transcriptional regulator [Jiangella endophytica]|uniref:LacI family DNA-binding transcriptional regulator n=1 Tax=Jiangella endophytica TaxID=1623398 RepID=UPI000E348AB5|nr:LacI family DNA-binding transcriptional regulator [Jiangella endophytica]